MKSESTPRIAVVETPASKAGETVGTAPPKKKNPFVIVGMVCALMLVCIGGYLLITAGEQNTDDAQVTADLVPIGTRVAGQVVKVDVAENQQVKKGTVLVEIDSADYEARVKEAEAELASQQAQAQAADAQVAVVSAGSKGGLFSARAALVGSNASVGSADAQVLSAKAQVLRAQADQKKAEIDLTRNKALFEAHAVAQDRVDTAQAAYDAANAALAQAQANVGFAEASRRAAQERVGEAQGKLSTSSPVEAQIATVRAQADLAHARVKSAEAALDIAKLQLSYTKVVAPADGIASKLSVHEGQLVAVGQAAIELVPLQTYIVANFKETQVGKMKIGQKAEIKVDAYGSRKFYGKVESISGGTGASFSLLPADNASGNFVKVVQRVPVRIAWENAPDVPFRAACLPT